MKKLLLVGVLLLAACSDKPGTIEVLRSQGYTNISTHGHAWFACSEDDKWATKFEATSPNGQSVSGAVCKGIFKGKTVRLN